ncbi:ATP-binding cassette domain-containing protein [Candidatus Uhrbacteria bacterium]|nr:ATP-binding cassette domain-containing protein [Candidatus Uhrbacteria bacterium]
MMSINVQGIGKSYDGKKVLEDISFGVQKGEIIAILGPSGCGKTTLLRCILGLETPDQGDIRIDSEKQNAWLKNKRIAYVSQQHANFSHLTVEQNILTAVQESVPNKEQIVTQILKSVGIGKYKAMYPNRLSGGTQQRVALARAIAQNTDIIAFDESLNALDVETRHQMQELILELWAEGKKTILFITHDIEEAIFLSRRIVVMGTRPGVVREILDIPFTYPRKSTLRFDEAFQKIRRTLSYIIRSETIKGMLSEGEPAQRGAINLGLYFWPGNSPFFYAQDKGLFDQYALPVELISFSDNRQKIEYWKSDHIDVLNVTVDVALRLIKEAPGAEIIAGLNISHGGDALISCGNYKTVESMRGKKIAIEKGEISEFFLNYILYKNGLQPRDVVIWDMKGDEIGAALINGSVDAAVLWEPWLSKAIELSRAHIIASSKEYPVFADVLIAKKDFIEKHGDEIKKIRKIWHESTGAYGEDKKDFIRAVAPMIGLSSQELTQQLEKIKFFDGSTDVVTKISKDIENVIE